MLGHVNTDTHIYIPIHLHSPKKHPRTPIPPLLIPLNNVGNLDKYNCWCLSSSSLNVYILYNVYEWIINKILILNVYMFYFVNKLHIHSRTWSWKANRYDWANHIEAYLIICSKRRCKQNIRMKTVTVWLCENWNNNRCIKCVELEHLWIIQSVYIPMQETVCVKDVHEMRFVFNGNIQNFILKHQNWRS